MAFSNYSLKARIYSFFIFIALISACNYGMMFYLDRLSDETFNHIRNTNERIELKNELLIHIIDAETGQRGFLLTGKKTYLEPFYDGLANAYTKLTELKNKNALAPEQQQRLSNVEILMAEKFAELKQTINLHESGKKEQALTIVESDIGKNFMDKIRLELANFDAMEKHNAVIAEQQFKIIRNKIDIAIIIELIAFITVFVLLIFYIQTALLNPIQKMYISAKDFKHKRKFTPVANSRSDEIGALITAFNTMIQKEVERINKLSTAVESAEQARDKAELESCIDSLTGLSNRKCMDMELKRQLHSYKQQNQPLSFILLDIDHFKRINDNYGHVTGDKVLKNFGKFIKDNIRETDLAFRYGGEEFLIILTQTSLTGAMNEAERLRIKINELPMTELNNNAITISLGITQLKHSDSNAEKVIARADAALYQAKNLGRNRSMSN